MSLWRVWMAPDDGLATLYSWRLTPDGLYEYTDVQVPYGEVETPYGTRALLEVDDVRLSRADR